MRCIINIATVDITTGRPSEAPDPTISEHHAGSIRTFRFLALWWTTLGA